MAVMAKKFQIIFLILLIIAFGLIGGLLGATSGEPREKTFTIEARQYAYEPAVIRVNRGDRITIKLSSKDVTHGFYLEGYDIDAKIRAQYPYFWVRHPSQGEEYEQTEQISFVADRSGKFRYRCSITCGSFHPFMQGELIVEPNFLFPASIGLAVGLAFAMIVYFGTEKIKR
jgi:cytochrome c oxidase subunit 2